MNTKLKLTLFALTLLTVFVAGILSKSKIESILQGANIGGTTKETIGNDKVAVTKELEAIKLEAIK
jgi:outer membrane murein-binding lipoprotein Lpp